MTDEQFFEYIKDKLGQDWVAPYFIGDDGKIMREKTLNLVAFRGLSEEDRKKLLEVAE